MSAKIQQSAGLPELVSVREFDAPRELVFAAWTDPEHFPHWFCPLGFETVLCEMDVRKGGSYRIHWKDKKGNIYPNKAEYHEVTAPSRLVYSDTWDDDRPENEPVTVTVTFEDIGGRTRMTSRSLFQNRDHLERIKAMGVEAGWAMFLDRLDAHLKSMRKQFSDIPETEPVISLTHIYDAPRKLVWEAFTRPEHLQHWWGPDGFSIEHMSGDFRVGGHWEFVMIGPDGKRWPNYHQYTEIDPMDRFRHLHGARANDPDAFDALITFAESGGKTEVTMRMTFPSLEARVEVLGYGADTLGLQTLAKAETYLEQNKVAL